MPPPLVARLQTLVPFWGTSDPATVPLRTVRLAAVLLAALNPAHWAVYRLTNPDGYDPLALRLGIVAVALGVLAASYAVPAVRDRPRRAAAVLLHATLSVYGYFAWANGLVAEYALGYLLVALAASMIGSMAWDRPAPLAWLLGAATAIALVIALVVDPAQAALHPLTFLLVMGTGAAVVFSSFYGRMRTAQDLRRSEAQLSDAEALAQTGAWTLELPDQRRTWTGGLYAMFGVDRTADGPPSLLDFVHPDDRETCRAEMARLASDGGRSDVRFRAVRPDGGVRWLHAVSDADASRPGEASLRGVLADVTEQVAREAALERARDAAEAANRTKSEFLANMSHEIRTPLTAIIGFAQMLREEVPEDTVDLVEPIETGGRRLLGTLNSVLDLARMEAGHADLALAPVDVGAEAREVAALLRGRADADGLALVVDVPDRPLWVSADADALGRVLTNLLSNAVKFTDAGTVTVAVRRACGRAEVVVADTGRGMDAAFLADLFEPFRQASTGWGRSHEGTGLGMTITRRLVEAMHGTISVESAPGRGTRFAVSLPLAALAGDGGPSDRRRFAAEISAPAPAAG